MSSTADLLPVPRTHDPGGKRLPLPPGVTASATYGGAGDCYRYTLIWQWDSPRRTLMFLGMNPSTAGHLCGDATVAKMCRLAQRWGYGALYVGNTFGYRATDQRRLAEVDDPIGPLNDSYVLHMADQASRIIVGYGTPKLVALRGRGPELCRKIVAAGLGGKMHALRVSADGTPHHPLYLPETMEPVRWEPGAPTPDLDPAYQPLPPLGDDAGAM